MTKRFNRLFCLLLVSALTVSTTACDKKIVQSGNETEQTEETTETTTFIEETIPQTTTIVETTTVNKESAFPEFFEISWLYGDCGLYDEGAFDELMLEGRYNVDFKIWNISHDDDVGLEMMLAAGDIPDIGLMSHSPMNPVQLYNEGYTRSINLNMFQQFFPYYYDLMLKNRPSSFQYNNITGTEEYYGISTIDPAYKNFDNSPVFRLDWLENIGYKIPEDLLTPITLTDEKLGTYNEQCYITGYMFRHDEVNAIFKAFTENDPDRNGEHDTFAGIIWPHFWRGRQADLLWGQFGLISSDENFLYRDLRTGDIVPWYAFTGYRDYMIWATEMNIKGYMRTLPDYNSHEMLLSTWMTGKVGFFTAQRQFICSYDNKQVHDRNIPQSIWLNGEENAKFVVMPALKGPGPDGSWGNRRSEMYAFGEGSHRTFIIGNTVSDEKLARILTIWNDYYSDPISYFSEQVFTGVEGVHFIWSGTPWNSAILYKSDESIPPQYRRGGFWKGEFSNELPIYLSEGYRQVLLFHINFKGAEKYGIEPYKYIDNINMGNKMYESYKKDILEFNTDINNLVEDFTKRVWSGKVSDIKAEWLTYLDKVYKAGLQELLNKYFNNPGFPVYQRPVLR